MGVGGDSYEKLLGNLELLKRLENSRIKIGIDCHGVDIDPDEYRETFKRFGFPISVGKPYSRGGSIGPLKNYGVSYGCSFMDSRLLNWLHIRANGDIALCCMDYTNDYIMGNVYELKTLDRLFESEAFKRIQAQAAGKGQPDGFICQKCEFGIRIPPASAPAPAAPKAKPPVAPPVPPPRASAPFQLSSSLLKALTRGYGRVVLYGAGRIAKRLLEEGARKGWPRPDLIVDDVRKDGELCGVPIRNLADERLAEDDLIVLATRLLPVRYEKTASPNRMQGQRCRPL
jgi:radical SAM protein with 4Fe4S-binding SPASM domain